MMRKVFLLAALAIIMAFTVSNVFYCFFEAVHNQQIAITTFTSIIAFIVVVFALFGGVYIGLSAFVISSSVFEKERPAFPRILSVLGIGTASIWLILYDLPVWWQSVGWGLVGIGLVALVCFLPRPGFLYPAQPPLPRENT